MEDRSPNANETQVLTNNLDPMHVRRVDPAEWRDGDEVVAEVTENIDPGPAIELVRLGIRRSIHEPA